MRVAGTEPRSNTRVGDADLLKYKQAFFCVVLDQAAKQKSAAQFELIEQLVLLLNA